MTFSVPVHNAGETTVDVQVAAVPGVAVHGTARVLAPAGMWSDVAFGVDVDCGVSASAPEVVTLVVDGDQHLDVRLPEEATVVSDLHEALCAPERNLTSGRLAGVWLTAHSGVVGRYRLRGRLLDAEQQGFSGYACLPGKAAVWRAGELWVLRRLAPPDPR